MDEKRERRLAVATTIFATIVPEDRDKQHIEMREFLLEDEPAFAFSTATFGEGPVWSNWAAVPAERWLGWVRVNLRLPRR
jgi:hypothetical protein